MKRSHSDHVFEGFSDDDARPTKKTTMKKKHSQPPHSNESHDTMRKRIQSLESKNSAMKAQLKKLKDSHAQLEDDANKLVISLGMTLVAGDALDQGILGLGSCLRNLREAFQEEKDRTEDDQYSIVEFLERCRYKMKVAAKSAKDLRLFAKDQLQKQPHLFKLCFEHEGDGESRAFSSSLELDRFVEGLHEVATSEKGSVVAFYEQFAKAMTEAEKSPDRESTSPPNGSNHSDPSSS